MTGPIAELVTDALDCVRAEVPQAWAEVERALGTRRFELEIEDEHFLVDLGAEIHGAVLSVTTDLDTLCAVIHGELELLDAILTGRLDVLAAPDDLVAAAAGLDSFIRGAVRCVSIESLLARLEALRKERSGHEPARA